MLPYKYSLKARFNVQVNNPIVNGTILHQNISDHDINITLGIKSTNNYVSSYGLAISIVDNNTLETVFSDERFSKNCCLKEDFIADEIADIINQYCFIDGNCFYFETMLHLSSLVDSINGNAFHLYFDLKRYTYGISIKDYFFRESLKIGNLEPIVRSRN